MNKAHVLHLLVPSSPSFQIFIFSGVTGVTSVTRILSQQTLTFLRNTQVTPAKLFGQSGVVPISTTVPA